jgi:hypothetical protein
LLDAALRTTIRSINTTLNLALEHGLEAGQALCNTDPTQLINVLQKVSAEGM